MTDKLRKRMALWVTLSLSGSGLVDVALRCERIGVANGLLEAAHDPGKVLFFVFFLPVAAFVLIRAIPLKKIKLSD